jgi:hypothetical protein
MEDSGSDSAGSGSESQKWDALRTRFQDSIMADTKLLSLAQNVGSDDWPIKGADETASKYVNFTDEELMMLPEIGPHPERIALLMEILTETLAFDDPFGEMVEQVEASYETEDNIRKTMAKLELPDAYPISLTSFTEETKKFCEAEDIETLAQFARFSQHMAENIVVGGDFRSLLNALANVDEAGIAQYIPFRPLATGLHLGEGIGLLVNSLGKDERLSLLQHYGARLTPDEDHGRRRLSTDEIEQVEAHLQYKLGPVIDWFEVEKEKLVTQILADEISVERFFVHLDDTQTELLAANTLNKLLDSLGIGTSQKKKGFFSRMFGKS